MAIKNYTTTIDVYKSLGEIQTALSCRGARKIMIDYDREGTPSGITFGMETPEGPRLFCLPANIEGVQEVFAREKVKAESRQAARTAWRNVRDWIMAQMAIIEAGQVEMSEVFLPYMQNKNGLTVYQLYKGGALALTGGDNQ